MSKKLTQVCKCENCGNEAEMVVTCSLPDAAEASRPHDHSPEGDGAVADKKVKGTATCTHCGNEADMWIDLDEDV
jgi:hypothetical protein